MKRLMLLLWKTSRADLHLLWHALKHPSRPGWLLPAVALLGMYAVSPLNLAIPLLGIVDDLVLVPLLLHFLVSRLPMEVRADAVRVTTPRRYR
ncbi:hypothetical protein [Noviherbaspirillum pedocola]|uniref:DUF1232 domain-containing protein n=1 Tax=Noviherbaspirillum pedocola TaxID=2801341 RepID=A0A934W7Z5_9BURK|nr:hypothetical protein [Noviherbaspirillum pedocola]MBK4738012.1 hypothetical protein [Noviherbaspirillum pedocola]